MLLCSRTRRKNRLPSGASMTVRRSVAAWLLSQYLLDKYGNEFATFDTDTSNRTLSQFKALPVRELQLSPDNMDIDPRRFDTMMEQLLTEDKEFVIDTGSNTFNQLWKYMVENDAMRMLEDHGKRVLLHSIVVGDQALVDTLNSLALLCKYSAKEKSVVVWLNEKYGKIEKDGKRFDQMKVFVEHEKKLLNGPLPRPCTRRNRHYPTAFWSSFLAAASLAALVVYAPAHNFNNPSHPCPFGERRQVWLAVVQPPSQTAYGEICTVSP